MLFPSYRTSSHYMARMSMVAVLVGIMSLCTALPGFAQTGVTEPDANGEQLHLPALFNGVKNEVERTGEGNTAISAPDALVEIAALPIGLSGEYSQIFFQGQAGIPNTLGSFERTGEAVAAGDFNGDGYMDLAAGVPYEFGDGTNDSGAVLILYGSAQGISSKGSHIIDATSPGLPADASLLEGVGQAVETGDFDGDGYADLVVGAYRYNFGDGAVLVLYGSLNGIATARSRLFSQAQDDVAGTAGFEDQMGWSVTTGDFDGNGYADIATGARYDDESGMDSHGAVVILYGSPEGATAAGSQIFTQETEQVAGAAHEYDQLGYAVSAGDVDGNGYDDLVVGIPSKDETVGTFPNSDAGAVLILYATPDGLLGQDSQVFPIPQGLDSFSTENAAMGHSVTVGDFDGNGYADIAAGAVGYSWFTQSSSHGAVAIYQGGENGATYHKMLRQGEDGIGGELDNGDETGTDLRSGDFNDDGFGDLAIGVGGELDPELGRVGAVFVIYGSLDGLQGQGRQTFQQGRDGLVDVPESDDWFGSAFAAGDFNGDGYSDLAVGVPDENSPVELGSASDSGAVMVIYAYAPNEVAVSDTEFKPRGVEGQPVATLPTFLLWNGSGGRHLNWRAETDAPWLSLAYTDALRVPISVTVGIDTTGLAQGLHSGHITLYGRRSDEISKTLTVTLTLADGGSPLLDVSPPLAQFSVRQGAAVPVTGTLAVRNLGPGALTWGASVTAGSDWLEIHGPTSGAADSYGNQIVIRPKAVASLAPGIYVGQVTFTSPDAQGSPQDVQVVISVPPPPKLTTNSRQRVFNAFYEDGPLWTQTLLLGNSGGGGSIPWSASATEQTGRGWLSLEASDGTTPGRLGVTVNTTNLTLGQIYQGQITITSPGAQGSPQVLNVTLKYGTNLRFAPKPASMYFYLVKGEAVPPPQTITIARSAGKVHTFTWQATITSQNGWLALDKKKGSAEAENVLQVSAALGNLPIGRYPGRVDFEGAIAQGLPRTIPIQLIVASKALAPRCQQLDQVLVDEVAASLKLEDVTVNPNPDGSCDISAYLVIKLPQNSTFRVQLSGTIDAQNRLVALVQENSITVKIADFQLTLKNMRLNDQTFTSDANWSFGKLSSAQPSAGKITIDRKGLTFSGSQSFNFNPAVGFDLSGFAVSLQTAKLTVDSYASSYSMELTGGVAIKAGKVASSAGIVLVVNSGGIHSTQINDFTLVGVAGLDLSVNGATFSGDSLVASSATFKVPTAWGGATTQVTGLKITKSGAISIGGGSFELPNIKAGDGFSLTGLKGSFATDKGDIIISADARFALPIGEGEGGCALEVGVTLRASTSAATVLEINSAPQVGVGPLAAAPLTTDRLVLNRILLGVWDCSINVAIPIGSTGLYVTGVRGTVLLDDGISSVKLEIQVRTGAQLGPKPLIYSESAVTFYMRPPALRLNSVVYTLGMKSAQTEVYISKETGFAATLIYEYYFFHADFGVDAWRGRDRFYITGTGNAYLVVPTGYFGSGCLDLGYKEFCANFPPNNWASPTAKAEFGTFSNNAIGVKGSIEYELEKWGETLISFRGGFYIDGDLNFYIGNVDRFTLATRPQVQAVQAIYAARARGEVVTASSPLDGQVGFAHNGDVLVAVPVDGPVMAADAEVPYTTALRKDLLFALTQPLTGTLTFALVAPDGSPILPATMPDNVAYQRDVAGEQVQLTYLVAMAAPGEWKMRIGGDTDNTDYVVMVVGNTPPPVVSGVRMLATPDPDQVKVDWRVQSGGQNITVNVFANPGPLTRTVTMTDPNGLVTSNVVDVFSGIPLSTTLPTKTDGSNNQALINLAHLPTGQYHLWLEADDGRNPPTRRQIASVQINRSGSFPGQGGPTPWTTSLETLEDTTTGDLQVQWSPHPHPDVDLYRVRMRSANPAAPGQMLVQEFLVGDTNQTLLDGLEPGRTYQIAIGAEDTATNQIAWSQETAVNTAQIDFTLDLAPEVLAATLPTGALPDTLLNGKEDAVQVLAGVERRIPLVVKMPDNPRYAVVLDVDHTLLPEGINVTFDQPIVSESGTVYMRVTAIREHAAGYFMLPVIGTSGTLVRNLGIVLDIQPTSRSIYVPLITS